MACIALEADPRSNGSDGLMACVPGPHKSTKSHQIKATRTLVVDLFIGSCRKLNKAWRFSLACLPELILLLQHLFSEQMKQRQKQMCKTGPTEMTNNQSIVTNEQVCFRCQQSTSTSSITRLALCHKQPASPCR